MSKHLVPWKRSVKGYKTGCQKVKHRFGPIKAGLTCLLSLADAVRPEGIPWILPRLDPGTLTVHFLHGLPNWVSYTHLWSLPALLSNLLLIWLLTSHLDLGKASPLGLSFLSWKRRSGAATGVVTAITKISHACCDTSNHSTIRNVYHKVTS